MNLYLKVCWLLFLVISQSAPATGLIQHLQFMVQPSGQPYETPGMKKFFACSAAGQPHPSYHWLKNSTTLDTPLMVIGTLILTNVGKADEGVYRCVVRHQHGALVSKAARVRVAYINLPDSLSTNSPIERTATQGQALVLDPVSVDSLPALIPQWFEEKDGSFRRLSTSDPFYHVTYEGQLIVLDIKGQEDGKMFMAVSSNPVFPNESASVTYRLLVHKDLQYKFEMVLPPKDVFANSGSSSVYFECVANARPLSSLNTQWYFKPQTRSNELRILNDDTKYLLSKYNRLLTIKHPSQSDEGTYRCEITTSSQIGQTSYLSRSARLVFQVAPTSPNHRSSTVPIAVDSGQSLELPCNIVGSPAPLVRWYYNAVTIEDHFRSTVLHDNTLKIKKTTKIDSGYYQCFASNVLGETFVAYYVNVTATMPVIVNMSPALDSVVIRGSLVVLHCNSRGTPKPEVTWYQVDLVSNVTQVLGPTSLEVNRMEVEAKVTSTYICQASNDEGQVDRAVRIRVAVPVRIFDLASRSLPQRQGNLSAVIGRPLDLGCVSSYDSAFQDQADMSWFKDGTRLPIHGEPGPTFVSLSDEVQEVFDHSSTESEAMEKLRRFLNGRIEDESVFGLLERPDPESKLIIRKLELAVSKVTRGHGGLYECRVSSPGSLESLSTLVTVVGPPEKPFNVTSRLSRFGNPWITVQWEPGHDGNSPVRRHLLYAHINDNLDPLETTRPSWGLLDSIEPSSSDRVAAYTIRGKPSHSYSFVVSSVNDVGESAKSDATEVLKVPMQIPSAPPLNVSGLATSESSILLAWTAPDRSEWNGPLLGYTARYRMSEGFRANMQHYHPWRDSNSYASINILDPKSRELKIDDLRPFTSYDLSVAAYNGIGIGPYSPVISLVTEEGVPKKAPGHVAVSPLNSTSINVTFILNDLEKFQGLVRGCRIYVERMFEGGSGAPSDNERLVKDYTIETPTSSSLYASYFESTQVHSVLVNDLGKYTWYQAGVACYNGKGEGPTSTKVKVQTLEDLPGKVDALRLANVTDVSFGVIWLPPTEPNGVLTNYVLSYKVNDKLMSHWLEPSQTSYVIGRFEFNSTYLVQVAASTRMGLGISEALTFKTPLPPEFPMPPTEIVVEEVTSETISLIVRRQQPTYVHLIVEVSTGPERDTFSALPDDYLSTLLPVDHNAYVEESNLTSSVSLFSNWQVKAEYQSREELEIPILLDNLRPYTAYRLRVYGKNSKGQSQKRWLPFFLMAESSIPAWSHETMCGKLYHGDRVVEDGRDLQKVVLQWMPLPRSLWHSPYRLTHYKVSGNCIGKAYDRPSGCLWGSKDSRADDKETGDSLVLASNATVHEIRHLASCRCPSFSVAACNEKGCSEEMVVEAGRPYDAGVAMTTDAVVHNLTLVSIQPTKMLLMWTPYGGDDDDNGDDDDDENKLHDPRCLAIKILYWRATAGRRGLNKVKRSPGNQFASHRTTHSKAGQSQAASRQPRYKIVSGRDRYTVINDLEPGTLYGFTVFPVDEEALRRHGGLDDVDNDEDVESASLLFAPVFAATRNDYHQLKSMPSYSSSSSDDWRRNTKNWMIIVASVVAGVIIIVVVISIYVLVRRTRPKKKKANNKASTSISLSSMTYNPLETSNHGKGQKEGKRSSWRKKGKQNDSKLYCGKAPPRPSPGSIQYNNNNNDSSEDPIEFPGDYDCDHRFLHGASGLEKATEGSCGDDDAPPLPPPPEVDPYDPDSIFSHHLTQMHGPVMLTNHFPTLPVGSSCCHMDDFVIDYYPQQIGYDLSVQKRLMPFDPLLAGHDPQGDRFYSHQGRPTLQYPDSYHGATVGQLQPLPPPPSPLQLEQLWLQRLPSQSGGGLFQPPPPPFGNPHCGIESETGEVKCMTIGRRYKSPRVAPYM